MSRPRPRIGFLVGYLAYEYETGMWRGLMRAAEARGVDLIAIDCSPDPAESPATRSFQRSLFDGLDLDGMIVSGVMGFTFQDEEIEAFLASLPPVPKVLIARSFGGRPSVFVDNRAGIFAMVDHLVRAHGRRRIALIAGHAHGGDAMQRHAAYREALGRHGLVYDPSLVFRPSGEYDPNVGAKAVKAIWRDAGHRPDGLVANNDDAAISAVKELVLGGFDVPRDVAVTGFDDIGPCLEVRPRITTVRQPHFEIGLSALDIVLGSLRGEQAPVTPVTVPGLPIFRRSCGCTYAQAVAFSASSAPLDRAPMRQDIAERLERAVDASLSSGTADAFLEAMDGAMAVDAPEPLFEQWVDRLKRLFASRTHGVDGTSAASRLYETALQQLALATNVIERSRAVETRNSYNVLNNYFSRSVFSFGNGGSGNALVESLPRLGIRDFILCTHEGSAEAARVQRVLPEESDTDPKAGADGSPARLVRRFMACRAAKGKAGPLVVMRLHHSGSDLGFFVCSVGIPDGSLYCSIQSQLSNGLKGYALLEAVQGYSRELERKVKTLSGFLPICASCKKVRDDKGYWNQVDAYISEHSEIEFSHGLCPDCARKLYPDLEIPGPQR